MYRFEITTLDLAIRVPILNVRKSYFLIAKLKIPVKKYQLLQTAKQSRNFRALLMLSNDTLISFVPFILTASGFSQVNNQF